MRIDSNLHLDAAMTFEEIGQIMGITKSAAWMLYSSALRKLRQRPHTLTLLKALANEMQKNRREVSE